MVHLYFEVGAKKDHFLVDSECLFDLGCKPTGWYCDVKTTNPKTVPVLSAVDMIFLSIMGDNQTSKKHFRNEKAWLNIIRSRWGPWEDQRDEDMMI